jgi:hypothetical protein
VKKLKRERDIKPVRDNLHISSRPCIYAIYRYICVIASFSFELSLGEKIKGIKFYPFNSPSLIKIIKFKLKKKKK